MNKIIAFLIIILAILGFIGGIGYTIYCGGWPIAVGVGVLGYLAWPEFEKYFKILME